MKYVALLRGINVGGNNKVEMKRLKAVFENAGMAGVGTYINSGNVIFSHDKQKDSTLTAILESSIEIEFGFHVGVLIKSKEEIEEVLAVVPAEWQNDKSMKCDVVFLWEGMDEKSAIEQLKARDGIDEFRVVPGVVVWKVDRENASRSGLLRIMGTPLYKQVTVRNINTTRKLLELMQQ